MLLFRGTRGFVALSVMKKSIRGEKKNVKKHSSIMTLIHELFLLPHVLLVPLYVWVVSLLHSLVCKI